MRCPVILVDTNVLLYAEDATSPSHDLIRPWWDAQLSGSNLVTDAHLAALAIEHGCVLISTDADFARFPRLAWRNPLR